MKTEEQLRQEHRRTPAGGLLAEMGMDYWDTESCAHLVAEHAAERIRKLELRLQQLSEAVIATHQPSYLNGVDNLKFHHALNLAKTYRKP